MVQNPPFRDKTHVRSGLVANVIIYHEEKRSLAFCAPVEMYLIRGFSFHVK